MKKILLRFDRPLKIIAGAVGLTALLLNFDFNLLEANLYDFRMARGTQIKADSDIVLVSLDDTTAKALDEFSPLPLDLHAQFLESLEKLQPKAVGYLVDMNQVNQVNPDLFRDQWGSRFVDAARRMGTSGIPVILGTAYDVTGEVIPPYPLSSLPHSIAVIHKDGNVFAEDKITRRALVSLNEKPVFHVDLAEKLGLVPQGSKPKGTFEVPEVDGEYFFFRYHGSTVLEKDKPFALAYPRISFLDVLRGNVQPEQIRGKIVLVGTLSRSDSSDFAFTPYSKYSFSNPKLVVHANILDSVLHGHSIVPAPRWVNWLTTFAVTTFVLSWVLNSTPLYGVFATLTLGFAFIILGQLLFQMDGVWLHESQPLVGIFVGYYLVVPYRLIREYKKRWEYQRKHELLTQVEELKTNFLQLVTHDLKTPVARIQGLAEVLLRKSSERLLDRDKETLNHIIHSTDELNRFITSILELHKVESNRLQLRFESKDLNQLIERSVEGFKAPARAKQIRILADLEPLFPVKMDSSLISKVLNNLIDNALKYSPEGSDIQIHSRELDIEGIQWIEVSVQDQGIGLNEEERDNLFTRFYRAKNEKTAGISGTGLGLYLTKYFIEAHDGRVEVQSEAGKGSVFKILLPAQPLATQPGRTAFGLNRLGAGLRSRFARTDQSAEVKESDYV